MKKGLVIFLFSIFIFGCEVEPYILAQNEGDPVIELNCYFTLDSIVYLTLSKSHFKAGIDYDSIDTSLKGATVNLFEDGKLVGTFTEESRRGSPYYINYSIKSNFPWQIPPTFYYLSHQTKVDAIYRIEVEAEGLESVWAESSIPPARGALISATMTRVGQLQGEQYSSISLELSNPSGIDYYNLDFEIFSHEIDTVTWDTVSGLEWIDPQVNVLAPENFTKTYRDNGLLGFQEIIYDDLEINNGNYILEMDDHFPDVAEVPNADVYSIMRLYLRNVPEEYYRYVDSAIKHLRSVNDPFTEPINMYSNVNGGRGIFTGYNLRVYEIHFGFRQFSDGNEYPIIK